MNSLKELRSLDLSLLRLTTFGLTSFKQMELWSAERISLVTLWKSSWVDVLHLRILPIGLWCRCVSLAQIHLLILDIVLRSTRSSVMDNHISCQSANVGVVRQLRNLRCINLRFIYIIEEGRELLLVIRLYLVSIFVWLWMSLYHISTVWHCLLLSTYLRYVQVCHVVKLLLRDWILPHFIVLHNVRCHNAMLIIVVVLVAHTYFLMIVPISRLTLLISDKRHTVDTWNTTLSINYLLVLLLFDIEVATCMQVKLFLGIQSI